MDVAPGHKRGILERLSAWIQREPEDREELLALLDRGSDSPIPG